MTDLLAQLEGSEDAAFVAIWETCKDLTMTSPERGLALFRATRYVAERGLPGSFVECGVWRGGSAMIAMLTLASMDRTDFEFHLFDTFDGMTEPGEFDVDMHGHHARDLLAADEERSSLVWARAMLEDVAANVRSTGYPEDKIHYIQGDVRKTVSATRTDRIALLRLDTDFYDSTKAELKHLYPRLIQHGVLIIDDYGHWEGCAKAVDEYFSPHHGSEDQMPIRPFFNRIDRTGLIGVRSEGNPPQKNPKYDYLPPRFKNPELLTKFPNAVPSDASAVKWPYLRQGSPHIWRTDTRADRDNIGILSMDEALVLHNLALSSPGPKALEIGCHLGWSTAHILAAGMDVDVIDPALARGGRQQILEAQFADLGYSDEQVRLWPGFSPHIVPAVSRQAKAAWSFVFIDGDHDGQGPLQDAEAVLPFCAEDAIVVFHDLLAPAVSVGLRFLKNAGWSVRIYNTTQVMGCAYRGNVTLVDHIPDAKLPHWSEVDHLADFAD